MPLYFSFTNEMGDADEDNKGERADEDGKQQEEESDVDERVNEGDNSSMDLLVVVVGLDHRDDRGFVDADDGVR